jgi:hypothetical protein
MDQASVFLAGSILTALGFIVVIGAMVVINNLLHKYWKPVRIFSIDSWHVNPPAAFMQDQPSKIEPALEPKIDNTKDSISKK